MHPNSIALLVLSLSCTAFAQPCTPGWSGEFSQDGPSFTLHAVTSFDPDGEGPLPEALVIGGNFTHIGTTPFSNVAMWDGPQWRQMGAGLGGIVRVLTVLDPDGPGPEGASLFAGGNFPGGVARWTGKGWVTVGAGSPARVYALAVFDDDGAGPNPPKLFAGGQVQQGPSLRGYFARLDGSVWIEPDPQTNNAVLCLKVFDFDAAGPSVPVLCAGGALDSSASTPLRGVAAWNGAAWSPVANAFIGTVQSLTTFDEDGAGPNGETLYLASSTAVRRWTGSAWSVVGGPAAWTGEALSLLVADDDGSGPRPESLHVFGSMTANSQSPAAARLEGNTWAAMSRGLNSTALASCTWDPDGPGPGPARVVVAGAFFNAPTSSGLATFAPRLAQWDGAAWSPIGSAANRGFNDAVNALAVYEENGQPRLFAGGKFTEAGGSPIAHLARRTGAAWSAVGEFNGPVESLVVFDEDGPTPRSLYAAGPFTSVDGVTVNDVARWDGNSWYAMGAGAAGNLGSMRYLAVVDPDGDGPIPSRLYLAGYRNLPTAGSSVQFWTGSVWEELPGISGNVHALIGFDTDGPGPQPQHLIAGNEPLTLNTPVVHTWNGQSWSPLGTLSGSVFKCLALCTHDEDGPGPNPPRLFAGGQLQLSPVRRWDGAAWTTVGSGLSADVRTMIVFDDDSDGEPSLIIGGSVGAKRWTGQSWTDLGGGVNDSVMTLAAFDSDGAGPGRPSLILGGQFSMAGAQSSQAIAQWSCGVGAVCYPNCDQSTASPALSANDFICFLTNFASADPYANCDGSTTAPILNAGDFQCFLNSFAAGCP